MFMRAAVTMHTFCLRIRSLSMDPFLITVSRGQSMRSFFNVVFRGRSALCGRDMVAGDANLDPRDKIACNISQLLIFNAVKGKMSGNCHCISLIIAYSVWSAPRTQVWPGLRISVPCIASSIACFIESWGKDIRLSKLD